MFPFNPQTLTVVVFVLSVACIWTGVWTGVRVQRAKRQKVAVEALNRLGGWVTYNYECDESGHQLENAKPPYPHWLRKLLGNDFFQHVVVATAPNDAALIYLIQEFPSLRGVELGLARDRSRVTDAAFAKIERLTELRVLGFWEAEVTDAGLQHVQALKGLQQLVLQHMPITDAGLEHLRGLTQLKQLVLASTWGTDQGVKRLQQALPDCRITWEPPTKDERQSPPSADQLR
jgi:hypothetical protein